MIAIMTSLETAGNSTAADVDSKIIRPHNVLRNIYSQRIVLVVASEGVLRVPDDLKTFTEGEHGVHVHYVKKLPLPEPNKYPIDCVVFVYKMFNKDSLVAIKESLSYIDVRYLVGRCVILVTSDVAYCQSETEEIRRFAKSYCLPVHYVSSKKDPDGAGVVRLRIPPNLMALYCQQLNNQVSSLEIDATVPI